MKKVLIAFLIILSIFIITGCSKEDSKKDESNKIIRCINKSKEEEKTISIEVDKDNKLLFITKKEKELSNYEIYCDLYTKTAKEENSKKYKFRKTTVDCDKNDKVVTITRKYDVLKNKEKIDIVNELKHVNGYGIINIDEWKDSLGEEYKCTEE